MNLEFLILTPYWFLILNYNYNDIKEHYLGVPRMFTITLLEVRLTSSTRLFH